MNAFWIMRAMFVRTWLKVIRRPVILLLSFVQPLIWMLFFGFLFHRFGLGDFPDQVSYLDFLMPGVCAMTLLLGASQSGIGFIRDIQTEFLERLLATPASRGCLLFGKLAADVSRLILQAAVVCVLGILLGARVHPAAGPVILAILCLTLFGVAYASLSCFIALKTRAQESMATFVHVVNMPLFFTSTALVPSKQMPSWLESIAVWNPLTLAVDTLREALLFGTVGNIAPRLAALAILAVVLFGLAALSMKVAD